MDGGVGVKYLKIFPHIHTVNLVVDGLIVPVGQVIVSKGNKFKSQKSAQCGTCIFINAAQIPKVFPE